MHETPQSPEDGPQQPDVQTSRRRVAATLLRQALGFRDCPREAIDALVATGHVATLGKGQMVVRRGDPFDKLCFVVEGGLEISVTQHNGRRYLVAYLQPGDVAGIMSLWDHLPHSNDLLARHPTTRVLLVPGSDWRALCALHPSLVQALELQMASRYRLLHERLIVDSAMSLEVRLARLLPLLLTISGQPAGAGDKPSIRITQADLGELLGVGRPRANFAVQKLKQLGLIELQYSAITIIDPAGLARLGNL